MKKQLYIETNDMKDLNIYIESVKLRIWLIRFEGNGYLLSMLYTVYAEHINIHIDVREFHIAKHACLILTYAKP
ncbi:hypothetical protein N665_0261s0041 [Sinapis alba]|nr:hypothetical protein N665_0261s0041 [Sinapis alba]